MSLHELIKDYEVDSHELSAYERLLLPEYDSRRKFYETFCCPQHRDPVKRDTGGEHLLYSEVVTSGMVFDDDHIVVLLSTQELSPLFVLFTYAGREGSADFDVSDIVEHKVVNASYELRTHYGMHLFHMNVHAISKFDGRNVSLNFSENGNYWQHVNNRALHPIEHVQAPQDIFSETMEILELTEDNNHPAYQSPQCLEI